MGLPRWGLQGGLLSLSEGLRRSEALVIRKDNAMTTRTQEIQYRDGDTELAGQLVWDEARKDRRPGILVVHGGGGLDEHAKGRARRFADPPARER